MKKLVAWLQAAAIAVVKAAVIVSAIKFGGTIGTAVVGTLCIAGSGYAVYRVIQSQVAPADLSVLAESAAETGLVATVVFSSAGVLPVVGLYVLVSATNTYYAALRIQEGNAAAIQKYVDEVARANRASTEGATDVPVEQPDQATEGAGSDITSTTSVASSGYVILETIRQEDEERLKRVEAMNEANRTQKWPDGDWHIEYGPLGAELCID